MKKFAYILFGILLVLSILVIGIFKPLTWWKHNANLQNFAAEFDQIPLPTDAYQQGYLYKYFGLMGNSNHCDYYASKLIETNLTEEELKAYFEKFTLAPADPYGRVYGGKQRGDSPVQVEIYQPWKEKITFGPAFTGTNEDKKQREQELQKDKWKEFADKHAIEPSTNSGHIFLIDSFDWDYVPDDIRCH